MGMVSRPAIVAVLVGALASLGASYPTPNFLVEAQTPEIAQQVGQYAEHYRREKALLWLGQEMPQWPQRCPLKVTISMRGSGGATSFAFDNGRILGMDMKIEGTLERLLNSVLPHEVTHTVFAHSFRCPVPRWADEGGAVLSEDDIERNRHDQLVRQILRTPGRSIPLRRLFMLKEYPPDVMVLYAEGFSVTNFLVSRSNRTVFLHFLAHGMRSGWDDAVRVHYRYRNVEELEGAWVQSLRETAPQPMQLASRNQAEQGGQPVPMATPQIVVRQTVPPAQPLLDTPRPIVRGQAPEGDGAYSPYPNQPSQMAVPVAWDERQPTNTPGGTAPYPQPQTNWQMQAQPSYVPPPPPVWLGSPQVENPSPVQLGSPVVPRHGP
jgi:hypothetical protein